MLGSLPEDAPDQQRPDDGHERANKRELACVVMSGGQALLHDPHQQVRPEQIERALDGPRPAEVRHDHDEIPRPHVVPEGDDRADGQVEPAEVEREKAVLPPAFEEVRPQLRAEPMRQPDDQQADGDHALDEQFQVHGEPPRSENPAIEPSTPRENPKDSGKTKIRAANLCLP